MGSSNWLEVRSGKAVLGEIGVAQRSDSGLELGAALLLESRNLVLSL